MSEENFGKTTPENWCQSVKEYRHENYLRTDPAIVAVGVKMEELETAVSKYINLISKPSWVRIFFVVSEQTLFFQCDFFSKF
jgi:23S rRNA maturation-related 3'-5' exoribonuclease YhaM